MKKTIIYLGLALVAFGNVAVASTVKTTPGFELVKEYRNTTPLGTAISKGDIETAKKLIEYGADVNEKCNGMTPLMMAARYNNVEMINLLLEKGADLRIKDNKGFTALKYAQLSNAKDAEEVIRTALKA
jgi:ankyrin repeat protein